MAPSPSANGTPCEEGVLKGGTTPRLHAPLPVRWLPELKLVSFQKPTLASSVTNCSSVSTTSIVRTSSIIASRLLTHQYQKDIDD